MSVVQDRGTATVRPGAVALSCRDWRYLPTCEVAPLLDAEIAAWRTTLAWDVTEAWRSIEPARLSGRLPGVVVCDGSGQPRGWSCFLDHHGVLQVATLVADTSIATTTLVREIVSSTESAQTKMQIVCVRSAAPRLGAELATHGFSVAGYRYLCRDLGASSLASTQSADLVSRPWSGSDLDAGAELCARAYAGCRDVRAFAPGGTASEWIEYMTTLVEGTGCGRLLPTASFVVDAASRVHLDGAILTTDLGVGTAHIAQVIVDPASQRRGFGRALLDTAISAATTLGFERVSLLVAESNAPAMTLYVSAGFRPRAKFVVGVRSADRERF